MTAQKKVTFIPADPKFEKKDIRSQHLRVAPYCRVSTDKDEQLSSYEAQIEYYTAKVNGNPDWTMVRLYADEGKTGTSTKKRKEFNRLIADCEAGKVDLVVTKSVSRFGRNTLDGLQYTRKLKRLGIGVYFEKENVNTLYMDNEMILTFFFSQAQAESESLSGNVKWGHRKNFKDGKVYYQYDSGKYAFSELLVCGECGSPYRRQTYMPRGEKYYVWRCLNRMENGTRICKNSPTFKERELQVAVIAAINEMFSQQKAKDAARGSVAAALAEESPKLSLPAIEAQLRAVQDRQMELMRLALNAGVDNTAYDDELQKIYAAKAQLMMLKEEMNHTEPTPTEYDDRLKRIDAALELDSGAIEEYDEIMVRQLVSNIKVLDAETILVRFKDGTEIRQRID